MATIATCWTAARRSRARPPLNGYIGSCMDITEQHERSSRRGGAKLAESASRAKDAFLATVSHELRAPLSPIITWRQMLRVGH